MVLFHVNGYICSTIIIVAEISIQITKKKKNMVFTEVNENNNYINDIVFW